MYETSGTIKLIEETQTFPSGFTKREFVVTTEHDKFPQDLKFEVVKDKCPLLDSFDVGQKVQLNFDIRGNEFKGRYYVNLSCWKIQPAGESSSSSPAGPSHRSHSDKEPSAADLRNENDYDDQDDIPF